MKTRKISLTEYGHIAPLTTQGYWKSIVDKEDMISWSKKEEVRELPKWTEPKQEKSVGAWNLVRNLLP